MLASQRKRRGRDLSITASQSEKTRDLRGLRVPHGERKRLFQLWLEQGPNRACASGHFRSGLEIVTKTSRRLRSCVMFAGIGMRGKAAT